MSLVEAAMRDQAERRELEVQSKAAVRKRGGPDGFSRSCDGCGNGIRDDNSHGACQRTFVCRKLYKGRQKASKAAG